MTEDNIEKKIDELEKKLLIMYDELPGLIQDLNSFLEHPDINAYTLPDIKNIEADLKYLFDEIRNIYNSNNYYYHRYLDILDDLDDYLEVYRPKDKVIVSKNAFTYMDDKVKEIGDILNQLERILALEIEH